MLSKAEIDAAIEKLKNQYRENHSKYGNIFDYSGFIKRYETILKNNGNLERFILDEIKFYDKLEEKVAEKEKLQKERTELNQRVDNIINNNEQKITKYPKISIHPGANYEIEHLYGILNRFYENEWFFISKLFFNITDSKIKSQFFAFEQKIESMARRSTKSESSRIDAYIAKLNQFPPTHSYVMNFEKDFIKEAGLFLNGLLKLLDTFKKEFLSNRSVNYRSSFGRILTKEEDALNDIIGNIDKIISDFRLTSFKEKRITRLY